MCWTEYGRGVFVHSHSHHGRWRGQWSMHSNEGDEEGVLGYTWVYSWMHADNEYARLKWVYTCMHVTHSAVVSIHVHTHLRRASSPIKCMHVYPRTRTCIHERARAYSYLTFYLQTRKLDSLKIKGGLWYESCRWWGVTFSGGVISAERLGHLGYYPNPALPWLIHSTS